MEDLVLTAIRYGCGLADKPLYLRKLDSALAGNLNDDVIELAAASVSPRATLLVAKSMLARNGASDINVLAYVLEDIAS